MEARLLLSGYRWHLGSQITESRSGIQRAPKTPAALDGPRMSGRAGGRARSNNLFDVDFVGQPVVGWTGGARVTSERAR